MKWTFQIKRLFGHVCVSLILMPFVATKWLTQIFVDCSRFNKGEVTEVRIE